MRSRQHTGRRATVPALGVALGIAAAIASASWSTAVAGQGGSEVGAVFDATHLPPLLTADGEDVALEYDVHCAASHDEPADAGCDVRGTAFVRTRGAGSFTALPLEESSHNGVRQLAVDVPEDIAASKGGVEYFAVLETPELGRRLVLPAAGAEAPHVSQRLDDAIRIDLGGQLLAARARFGTRVALAHWGDGPGRAGLESGRNLNPIGASGFAVDSRGNVSLLDQVHRRVLRWRTGATTPEQIPIYVNGTLADLVADDDGSMFVLETTARLGRVPTVRRFDDDGRELEAIEVADRTSQIRVDADGPVVLGESSHQWLPVLIGGVPAAPREQAAHGRGERRFQGGVELVVLRRENEIRIAVVSGEAITRSWRLTSDTPLAEVQLAEPFGQRIVLVVRAYEQGLGDAFLVLILGRRGLVDRFVIDSADWAETAPLGRFKLVGRSLYRLGSTPEGVFVDRFDLEVR